MARRDGAATAATYHLLDPEGRPIGRVVGALSTPVLGPGAATVLLTRDRGPRPARRTGEARWIRPRP